MFTRVSLGVLAGTILGLVLGFGAGAYVFCLYDGEQCGLGGCFTAPIGALAGGFAGGFIAKRR
jgi:hypothetical protein